ncbi:hypothetical protein PMI16_02127 [Herbaspirillum sp. CF444]|uniref:hypothetical protein n=1 Tax=Herbaspirillum sp. CF444 TaxID=1144319 RepID=UPI00027268C2|nr:hypothetical protein [Herbaspirillum sp. CF444]EJL88979.1 hypothetical protein PMI16_02127 [Herbaspirillum sp. CF444]
MALDSLTSIWTEAPSEPPAPRPKPRPAAPMAGVAVRTPTPPTPAPTPLRQQARTQNNDERDTRKSNQRNETAGAGTLSASSVWLPPGLFDASGGDGHSGGGHEACEQAGAADDSGDCDAEALLGLLPSDGQSGIFEILLPNGERMGVMVDVRESSASFLLSPSGDRLRDLLRKKRMELEEGLARRMDKYVRLAVL